MEMNDFAWAQWKNAHLLADDIMLAVESSWGSTHEWLTNVVQH